MFAKTNQAIPLTLAHRPLPSSDRTRAAAKPSTSSTPASPVLSRQDYTHLSIRDDPRISARTKKLVEQVRAHITTFCPAEL